MEAQSLSVKRAEVEFHKFASLGEPDRAVAAYAEENVKRGGFIRKHLEFIGTLSPFLEIGAGPGHTSYMIVNEFGADGFALDISADALRYGQVLMTRWGFSRAPTRIAGDALHLPFRDGSLRLVLACQMLSQFMDIESVLVEVKRVLAPGGVFLFAEEPLRRMLTLGLYHCPYWNRMKPWERRLFDWGLLGYLVKDVIGAEQEESLGIRQNHSLYLRDWHRLIKKHFVAHQQVVLVRQRGWGQRWVRNLAVRLDPYRSEWRAAHLLGGVLSAVCRKEGAALENAAAPDRFESLLCCPDCGSGLRREEDHALACRACSYRAASEDGVYNLLPSGERRVLYPGDRPDILDFSQPSHAARLLEGWYELEGVFGNKFRWIGPRASARLVRVEAGPQRLRLRAFLHELAFKQRRAVKVAVAASGEPLGERTLRRPGLFLFEADLPEAPEYRIDIAATPAWTTPGDQRLRTIIVSGIRLTPT